MISQARVPFSAILLACYLTPSLARVMWTQESFDPSSAGSIDITKRASSQCGGHSELQQCGSSYPSDFCCPTTTRCLPLNGTTATAVICCQLGQDCSTIKPLTCDRRAQNPTLSPTNLIHSVPQQRLSKCGGTQCCPDGYTCQDGICFAIKDSTKSSSTSSTATSTLTSTSPSVTSIASSAASPTATSTTTFPAFLTTSVPSASNTGRSSGNSTSDSSDFSGKSFAAGFVPGIALGAILLAIVLWFLARRRKDSDSYVNEKSKDRDTLTDLSTLPASTSSHHGRSISEPTMDPSMSYRTDFLRGTPPRINDIKISSPITNHNNRFQTPSSGATALTLKTNPTLSHSPFIDRAPSTPAPSQVPNHLKRGTLSFKISPVRALKKQRSIHSLRRQITNASSATTNPSRNGSSRSQAQGASRSRSRSTETIQVLMPSMEPYTPEHRAQMPSLTTELDEPSYDLPDSPSSWDSDGTVNGVPVATSPPDPTPDRRQAYQRQQPQAQLRPQQQQQYPPQTRQATLPANDTPTRSTDRNLLGSPYTTPNNAAIRGRDSAFTLTTTSATTPPTSVSTTASKSKAEAVPLAMRPQAPPPLRIPSAEARQGQGQGQSFSTLMEKAGIRQEELIGAAGSPGWKGKGRVR